jgi:hypothetical protein
MAENAVSQRYVVEKQRRNLTAVSCKFGYSFFILIQNFELLILKVLSSPLSYYDRRGSGWELPVKGTFSGFFLFLCIKTHINIRTIILGKIKQNK